MRFIFKAKDNQGKIKEGVIETADKDAAIKIIQKNNLYPISLREEDKKNTLEKIFLKYYERVTNKELVVFFRQLAVLIEAKVPVIVALSAIREQTSNQYFIRVTQELIDDIQDGMPFSSALKKHPDVFSKLSISIIKAGETSGNLRKSVEYVANNIEKNYNLVSKVRSAMLYPAVILVVFFIIGFLIISFVVPKLTTMIKELDAPMPWYTLIVLRISDFMSTYWWAVAIFILGVIFGILYYIRTEEGRKDWDQIKIKIPIIGIIFKYIYITRFAENLSVLLLGGIPIIRSMKIVSFVINNSVYEQIFLQAAEEVKIGGEMSDVLKKYPEIPPIVTQMVRIGEESGQLDSVLKNIADFYERETDVMTRNLSTLIEPVLMIVIGAAVGFLAFSVLMPIYNIAGSF